MESLNEEYLGDSVYAFYDGYGIVLTTRNGAEASNTIYLEPSVVHSLDAFYSRMLESKTNELGEE